MTNSSTSENNTGGSAFNTTANGDLPILEVNGLTTHFFLEEGTVRAVDDVSFDIGRSVVLGVVGESGCGKSVLARSIMRIVRPPGRTLGGEILYRRPSRNGESSTGADAIDLNGLSADGSEMRNIRGSEITMVL